MSRSVLKSILPLLLVLILSGLAFKFQTPSPDFPDWRPAAQVTDSPQRLLESLWTIHADRTATATGQNRTWPPQHYTLDLAGSPVTVHALVWGEIGSEQVMGSVWKLEGEVWKPLGSDIWPAGEDGWEESFRNARLAVPYDVVAQLKRCQPWEVTAGTKTSDGYLVFHIESQDWWGTVENDGTVTMQVGIKKQTRRLSPVDYLWLVARLFGPGMQEIVAASGPGSNPLKVTCMLAAKTGPVTFTLSDPDGAWTRHFSALLEPAI